MLARTSPFSLSTSFKTTKIKINEKTNQYIKTQPQIINDNIKEESLTSPLEVFWLVGKQLTQRLHIHIGIHLLVACHY